MRIVVHNFYRNGLSRRHLGGPSRARDAIHDHQMSFSIARHFRRRHAVEAIAVPGVLKCQLERIGPIIPFGRQVQCSRINLKELAGHRLFLRGPIQVF